MPDALGLALALAALAGAMITAVTRPPWLSEAAVAAGGAGVLVIVGASSVAGARQALADIGPTVGFLAALLVLGEGCRREGLFEAIGVLLAGSAHGDLRRLLALVVVSAALVTAILSLDATVVLLTPIVFSTATRLRASPKPHVYACTHLANSASLLLPVSNLTNLLAFHASGLSFTRFAALMALPWLAALAVEWAVLRRAFASELGRRHGLAGPPAGAVPAPLPRYPLVVLALTLAGFALTAVVHVAPLWIAAAGAVAISVPALARRATTGVAIASAAEPALLVFVLGLGVIVHTASAHGLGSAVRTLLPLGSSLPDLLAVAALSAALANLLNNLPATLILVPLAAGGGPTSMLAALIGVNVGPNLTYVGSLATLLWRRVLRSEDADVALGEFVRFGAMTVPATLVLCTVALWFSAQGLL